MKSSSTMTAGGVASAAERDYWHRQLAGERRPCGLRLDHGRPEQAAGPGEARAAIVHEIGGAVFAKLARLSGGEPFLEYAAMTAALTACLHRYTQASPIAIGCPAMRSAEAPEDPRNVVVVSNEVDGQMTFRQLLLRVRRTLLEAHAHQGHPFVQLLAELCPGAPANRCPLFDVALVYRGLHHPLPEAGHDLTLTCERGAESIRCTAAWRRGLFEPATVERFCQHLERLLDAGLEDTGASLAALDMLTAEERRRLLREWNDSARDYPRDRCVHELFEAQAERTPDRQALVYEEQRLSYGELDRLANQLAHHLQRLGVTANTPVGIFMNRSPELVVAVLAVLKAGGAYVPYDPTYPRERLAGLFEDVRLKVLLTRQDLLARLPEHRPRVVCLDRDRETVARQPGHKPRQRSGPSDLCYVIFTSGSTGRPKAAAVYHRGWTNLLCWFVREFAIAPADRTLVMSSISFDITQRSMAMPLTSGGELHLMPDGYDPDRILATLRERQITLLNCAPSTFYPLVEGTGEDREAGLRSLRCLFLGGEAISASRLRSWAEARNGAVEIVNVYGAAECSDVSSFYRLHDFDRYAAASVPIGRPIANSRIYVVDEELRPVPTGVAGEICLAGEGVGRGYINDPVLTARKFVDDPYAGEAGARLYRTGDLGRHLPDGALEFCGRIDHQVKIRGLRIELGEIETELRAHPGVKEAVVTAPEQAPGDQRLAAYYVASRPEAAGADDGLEDELREALARKLPAYMIPNLFVRLPAMPLNPNGKIDREALPVPSAGRGAVAAAEAPCTPLEQAVAAVFAAVLKVPAVGRNANFFRLGGHSLMATQMIASLSETFGVRLLAVDFFARPTVAAIAERLGASGAGDAPAAAAAAGPATMGANRTPAGRRRPGRRGHGCGAR